MAAKIEVLRGAVSRGSRLQRVELIAPLVQPLALGRIGTPRPYKKVRRGLKRPRSFSGSTINSRPWTYYFFWRHVELAVGDSRNSLGSARR